MADKNLQQNSGLGDLCITRPKAYKFTLPILRVGILAFSVVALILMIVNKEHAVIDVADFLPTLPPGIVYADKYASYKLITALKFYVGATAIVASYTIFHIITNIVFLVIGSCMEEGPKMKWFIFIFDQAIAYLLASAVSVVIEVGYLSKEGAEELMWNPIGKYFKHYCTEFTIGVGFCTLASILSYIVAAISAYQLFRHRAISIVQSNSSYKGF